MNIIHIIANLSYRYGGPAKACVEMARAIANLGHSVSIYTTDLDVSEGLAGPLDYLKLNNKVEIIFFPIQYPRFWGTSFAMAKAIRKEIHNFDIAHIHSLYLFHAFIAGYYCRKYNVPYLVRPHGSLDPFIYERHRYRKMLMEVIFNNRNIKHASAIHFTTEEEKELASPYTYNSPGIVVPIGINLSEFDKMPESGTFKRNYPEIKGKKIILFLGRINFKKGLDILVSAFTRIAEIREDVHLVIAGPDNENFSSKVRLWLNEQGILDRTTFTGMLLEEEKLAVLKDADIFVLPSYSENFGISVIEAMACGIPVVISNKVNIWREVVKGGAGRVTSCNAHSFSKVILELLNNMKLAKELGARGKLLVKKHFLWSSIAPSLENAYYSIILSKDIKMQQKLALY